MPSWVIGLGATAGKVLLGMAAELVTEKFLKSVIIYLLEYAVKKTKTDVDDKLLKHAKEAWNKAEEDE